MIDRAQAEALARRGGEVGVVLARVGAADPVHGDLDADELARLHRLRRPADRQRFAVAHTLLRSVAGAATGRPASEVRWLTRCAVCGGPHGRPAMAPVRAGAPVPLLSLSYAGDLAVVALSWEGQVGVDVESAAGARAHDLSGVVDGDDPALTWVRTEAVLKATGDGMRVDPGDLAIRGGPGRPRLVAWRGRPLPDVRLVDLEPGDGYVGALALLPAPGAPDPRVVVHRAGAAQRPGGA
ncbi:MAG TPA: hypothetical protein VF661_13575 [Actinomycetales bacterium]